MTQKLKKQNNKQDYSRELTEKNSVLRMGRSINTHFLFCVSVCVCLYFVSTVEYLPCTEIIQKNDLAVRPYARFWNSLLFTLWYPRLATFRIFLLLCFLCPSVIVMGLQAPPWLCLALIFPMDSNNLHLDH